MLQRILLSQNDAAAAKAIVDALNRYSDDSLQVEWARCCSDAAPCQWRNLPDARRNRYGDAASIVSAVIDIRDIARGR